jgi:hypothetical protein
MHLLAFTRTFAALGAAATLLAFAPHAAAQGTVNALCSTDAGWCEAAAAAFTRETGIKVLQAHKGTGEIGAQLRAEAANPKTDIWWGGTGDPFLQGGRAGPARALPPGLHQRPARLGRAPVRAVAEHGRRLLHQRDGLRLQHRAAEEKEAARAALLGRPREARLQGRDRDLAPGHQRHGLHHHRGPGAADGRGGRLRLPEEAASQRHQLHAQRPGPGAQRRQGRGRGRRELHLRLRALAPRRLSGQDRRALRGHGLRDRRHRAGEGRAQQGEREALLRLAHESRGPVHRRQGRQPAVAGQQDLQARSAHSPRWTA